MPTQISNNVKTIENITTINKSIPQNNIAAYLLLTIYITDPIKKNNEPTIEPIVKYIIKGRFNSNFICYEVDLALEL